MQVGLVTGKRRIELQTFPEPQPAPGKAVVHIAYCGICGTDLHAYLSGEPYNPAICGHEWSGTVAAAAPDGGPQEGDRVAIGVAGACGRCAACRRGDHAHCEDAFAGLIGQGPRAAAHGGFASAIAIDAGRLYGVARGIDDVQAAMLEPATIAVHAVRRTPIRLGDVVVVLGAGPIGLLVAQCAQIAGAGAVVVVEPQAERRALARTLGADLLIDPDQEDTRTRLGAFAGSDADVVFECAGIPSTIDTAVSLCRRGGTVSLVGVPDAPSTIHGAAWLVKEVNLTASLGYQREEFDITQRLVQDGRLQLTPLHSDTVGLSGLADAFAALTENPSNIKVLVDPGR